MPTVELTEAERSWLESAAQQASEDKIARGLGSADALRALALKLLAAKGY